MLCAYLYIYICICIYKLSRVLSTSCLGVFGGAGPSGRPLAITMRFLTNNCYGFANYEPKRSNGSLLYHCCITCVSLVYHCCITCVSLLHHCCITCVSLVYHQSGRQFEPPMAGTRFRFESPLLPDDPESAPKVFQKCSKRATKVIQMCYKSCPEVIQSDQNVIQH